MTDIQKLARVFRDTGMPFWYDSPDERHRAMWRGQKCHQALVLGHGVLSLIFDKDNRFLGYTDDEYGEETKRGANVGPPPPDWLFED